MAVTIMSSNYVLLEKLNITPELILNLKEKKIKLATGFKSLKLVSAEGEVLGEYTWPEGATPDKIMGGKLSHGMYGVVQSSIQAVIVNAIAPIGQLKIVIEQDVEAVKDAVTASEIAKLFPGTTVKVSGLPDEVLAKSPFKKLEQAMEDDPALKAHVLNTHQKAGDKGALNPQDIVKMPQIALKDATMIYQPVRGTDKTSRYFVAAMNDDIKIAVRVSGNAVSIRVEGNLTPAIRKALAEQGIDDKGQYMSKHRNTEKTTPAKYIGAVLMATGLHFDTPLPNMEIIQNAK